MTPDDVARAQAAHAAAAAQATADVERRPKPRRWAARFPELVGVTAPGCAKEDSDGK